MVGAIRLAAAGIAPAGIVFASQQVASSSAPQEVTISNQAHGPITIRSVHASGDFTESDNCVSSAPLVAGASCTATVKFVPSSVGERRGALMVTDSFDTVSPAITLLGTAVPAPDFSLSVNPASAKIRRDHPATYELILTPIGGFDQTVNLTCIGEPSVTTCSISPRTVTLDGKNPSVVTVTVSFDRHDHFESSRSDGDEGHSEEQEHRKFTLTFEGIAGNITHNTQARLIVEESPRLDRD